MRLVHPDGWYFALAIVGYQFPHLATNEDDLNWLNVAIEVWHPRGRWKAVDAALLTYEADALAHWLSEVARGRRDEPSMCFLEPCLSFGLSRDLERNEELVVELGHEFRPHWVTGDLDESEYLVFPLAQIDLLAAADSLRRQLSSYPQRVEE